MPAVRRFIAHLDMDAFYASVELLRYPQLKGQPVVIGGGRRHQPVERDDGQQHFARLRDYVGRGVITTATYPARALGVHSGMGLMKAAALAPDAVLLPVDFDQYRAYSRRFKAAVAQIATLIEDRGIDEIYIDLTDIPGAQQTADGDELAGVRALAARLKAAVTEATGLTCSIGVTPNKLLSKLCSDLDKPDGLTVLMPDDIPSRIWPLPASRINGIGPKASAKLARLGIDTIGQLAQADQAWLIEQFGSNYGAWLHAAAHGRDERPVVTWRAPKSLSRETTFERDLHPRDDREALSPIFTRLCEQVAQDLLRKDYLGRTVGVKLRYDDFKIVTRSMTMPAPTRDATVIRQWAGRCLKTVPLDRRLRLLGVKMESLCKPDEAVLAQEPGVPYSLPLFEDL
ncbi:MAG: DNA polymerase IV [Aquabacterium sp.]|uniref:DNA polymerase IV n=1 Tax=Aquabacterium sp. TaxID=1872578 RepID=UPI0012279A35|nr:DNA polymerase IV [Aquabacterium sp.]TAK92776.1 MAG: DNA polymerase IV [Aquabacterium sp.]